MPRLQVIPLPHPQIEGRIFEPPFIDGFPPPPPPFPLEPVMDWELVAMGVDIVMFLFFLWLVYAIIVYSGPMGGGGGVFFGNFGSGYGHHHHYGGARPVVAGRPHIHSGGFGGFHGSGSHSHSHSSGGHVHGRRRREARNGWVDEPEVIQLLSEILAEPKYCKE